MTDLAISTAAETWPTFHATEEHEFVETWRTLEESVEGHRWQQAAIAYAWRERFGPRSLGEFASKVGTSTRRIQEYERTYRVWALRERSRILSFHHHTIAARGTSHDLEPEVAIQIAETPPIDGRNYPLSTRELDAFVKTRVLPDGASLAPETGAAKPAEDNSEAGHGLALTPNEAFYLYELVTREYDEQRYAIAAADNALLVIAGKLKRIADSC